MDMDSSYTSFQPGASGDGTRVRAKCYLRASLHREQLPEHGIRFDSMTPVNRAAWIQEPKAALEPRAADYNPPSQDEIVIKVCDTSPVFDAIVYETRE